MINITENPDLLWGQKREGGEVEEEEQSIKELSEQSNSPRSLLRISRRIVLSYPSDFRCFTKLTHSLFVFFKKFLEFCSNLKYLENRIHRDWHGLCTVARYTRDCLDIPDLQLHRLYYSLSVTEWRSKWCHPLNFAFPHLPSLLFSPFSEDAEFTPFTSEVS